MDVISKYIYAGLGVAITLLLVGVVILKLQLGSTQLEAETYKTQIANITAGADAAAAKESAAQSVKDQTATVKKLTDEKIDLQRQLEVLNEIHDSPKSDDGLVAPVLSRTIDGLRSNSTPAHN